MCDIRADDLAEIARKPPIQSLIGKLCKKCAVESGTVVLRVNEVYCKSCFLSYFIHKYRACIGKSKLMKPSDQVLVACSGGPTSMALVHLIKESLEDDNKKKLRYTPLLLYIDEGIILEQSLDERNNICNEVVKHLSWSGFPVYFTTLEMMNSTSSDNIFVAGSYEQGNSLPIDLKSGEQVKALFATVTSLTAKEDLLQRLRHRLICKVAEKLSCSKVFLGESGSRLAVRLLTDVAQGRGDQLVETVGFSHSWGEQLLILRPMKEFVAKEIATYNNLNHLTTVTIPALETKADLRASISRLTENFIQGLQAEFPATTSTILRTGDKLRTGFKSVSKEICILCQSSMGTSTVSCSGLPIKEAEISRLSLEQSPGCSKEQSTTSTDVACSSNSCCKNISCRQQNVKTTASDKDQDVTKLTKDELFPFLCYGCRRLVGEMNNVDVLPAAIYEEVKFRNRRLQMKSEISEFLLDEVEPT